MGKVTPSVVFETLENSEGLPVRVELRHPDDGIARGTVVICHGFKGFKQWGFFPYLGDRLAREGWLAVSVDFSCNGIGDDPLEFTRLDLFARNTYSREVEDLGLVLDWLDAAVQAAAVPVGLIGHSRGAVPVMVAARERPRVGAIVTWSGVGKLLRPSAAQLDRWRAQGTMEFVNARTGQKMAMSYDFVRDVEANAERFSLERAAMEMRAAHLILHGTGDLAVPVEEAQVLRAGREERSGCRVIEVEGATHTFGAVHPFDGTTPHLETVIGHTLEWFDKHLA